MTLNQNSQQNLSTYSLKTAQQQQQKISNIKIFKFHHHHLHMICIQHSNTCKYATHRESRERNEMIFMCKIILMECLIIDDMNMFILYTHTASPEEFCCCCLGSVVVIAVYGFSSCGEL